MGSETGHFHWYQVEAQASVEEAIKERQECCPYCPTDEIYVNEAGGMRHYQSFWHLVGNRWIECVYPLEYWNDQLERANRKVKS
jgi:hypothetical protein